MHATIETGLAVPKRGPTSFGKEVSITESLRACEVGQSFVLDDIRFKNSCHAIAHRLGMKIRTEKVPMVGIRVHRIK